MRASSNPPQACLPDPHPSTRLPAWPSPLPPPQACLSDPHPGVSSLGLEAVDLACREDVLDFYKAWKVRAELQGGCTPEE